MIESDGSHGCRWAFPLHPGAEAEVEGEECVIRLPGFDVRLKAPDCDLSLDQGWYSPSYGKKEPAGLIRATRSSVAGRDQQKFSFTVHVHSS